jgi:hypothetical protein
MSDPTLTHDEWRSEYARKQWYHPDNVRAPWRTGTILRTRTVACKVPGLGIVRAIDPRGWTRPEELVDAVLRIVGSLRPDVEWTGYTYGGVPGYLRYVQDWKLIEDALPRPAVWLFPWGTEPGPDYIGSTLPEAQWLADV